MFFIRSTSMCVCVLNLLTDFQCVFILGAATVTGAHQGGGQTNGFAMKFVVYITDKSWTSGPVLRFAAQLCEES